MNKNATLRVAVAQTECKLGDIDHNLAVHREIILEADAAGVQVLLFPELSLVGYALGRDVPDLAMQRDDARLLELAALAPRMTVVVGFVEEGESVLYYNAAAVLRDGDVGFVHRKLNLPTYGNLEEGKIFAQGRSLETIGIEGPWRGGLLICADLWNPALTHIMMLRGCTLLLAPVNSAVEAVGEEFSNPKGWETALEFYSMMYGVPVLMANRIGPENNAHFWGGSRILDPYGDTIAHAAEARPCLLTADLQYRDVRQARFRLPTLRDANMDLIQREFKRLAG